jgi:hypothetical protein
MLSMLLKTASSQLPIQYIGESTTQTSTATFSTVVVSKPTGTTQGDLMIMIGAIGSGTSRTWTGDTGWTEVADQNSPPNLRVAYKVAGASEPSSYTFAISSSTNSGIAASILTYRYAAYDTIGAFTSGTNPLILPSVTASKNLSVLIAAGARVDANTVLGTPTGMTARVTNSDSTRPSYKICDQSVDAGATGTRSMSSGSTNEVAGIMLVIKPA